MNERSGSTVILEMDSGEAVAPILETQTVAKAPAELAHPQAIKPLGRLGTFPGLQEAVEAADATAGFSSR